MEYKQDIQKSRVYEYGPGKEFKTREEALQKIEKVEQKLKTELAQQRLYNLSKVKRVEKENSFQLILMIRIPVLLNENQEEEE